jgi:hypothetical protein
MHANRSDAERPILRQPQRRVRNLLVLCENHASRAAARQFHPMLSEESAKPLDLIRNLVRAILSRGVADIAIDVRRRCAWHPFKQDMPQA